jgi:hypothetical protein
MLLQLVHFLFAIKLWYQIGLLTTAHENILYVSVSIHPLTLSPVHGIENLEIIYNLDDMIIHLLYMHCGNITLTYKY